MFSRFFSISLTVTLIVGLSVIVYIQRDDFSRGLQNVSARIQSLIYPPCSRAIGYRLGDFSDRFGMSREEFIGVLQEAEKIWEQPIDKDLFSYVSEGDLVINLVYDDRQKTTDVLKDLDDSLDRSRASYEVIKTTYQRQAADYEQARGQFEQLVQSYEVKRSVYEQQVSSYNKRGGANEAQYDRLEQERIRLNQAVASLRSQQDKLQEQARQVNALAEDLNARAAELNLAVDTYNAVGDTVGEEFDEGLYRVDAEGRNIDVFQFENRQQLIRLLAHEFGHALGIEHVDDPDAVMYRLNQSQTMVLSPDDLLALRAACQL